MVEPLVKVTKLFVLLMLIDKFEGFFFFLSTVYLLSRIFIMSDETTQTFLPVPAMPKNAAISCSGSFKQIAIICLSSILDAQIP